MPTIRFGKLADLSEAGFRIPESGHEFRTPAASTRTPA